MKWETPHKRLRASESVSVMALSAEEQAQRVRDAVASRAYQISETHKETEPRLDHDWVKAESEVIHPFCGGRMPINGKLWLGTDPGIFKEGSIELWVAPHRLTVCGLPRAGEEAVPSEESPAPGLEKIYEVIELREEVDPGRVSAGVRSATLEIVLGKPEHGKEAEKEFKEAA